MAISPRDKDDVASAFSIFDLVSLSLRNRSEVEHKKISYIRSPLLILILDSGLLTKDENLAMQCY